MAKVTRHSNYRGEVRPKTLPSWDAEMLCERLRDSIVHHVNIIESCEVKHDSKDVCSFCGKPWGRVTVCGGPMCCDEANREYEKAKDHA